MVVLAAVVAVAITTSLWRSGYHHVMFMHKERDLRLSCVYMCMYMFVYIFRRAYRKEKWKGGEGRKEKKRKERKKEGK